MRYTASPQWLRLPRPNALRRTVQREGMPPLNQEETDLVHDMICRSAGIAMQPYSAAAHAPAADQYSKQVTTDLYGSYAASDPSLRHQARSEYYAQQRARYQLIRDLPVGSFSGASSMQQAVRLVKFLRILQELQPPFSMQGQPDWVAILMDAQRTAQSMRGQLLPLLLPFTGEDQSEDTVNQMVQEFAVRNLQLAEMLRICRQMDEVSQLDSAKSPPRPDPEGEDVRYRGIRQLSELPRASQSDLALPKRLMMFRAAVGDMAVRETITHREDKQLLYLLVDATGSMLSERFGLGRKDGLPLARAAGVVLNRLQAVIDGDAELYLRFFDTTLGEVEYHAHSAESARELMEVITNPKTYSGGSTNFVRPLTDAGARVRELVAAGKFRDPVVTMITDGQAGIPDPSVLNGAKLHTIQVGIERVDDLAKLAKLTGGVNIDAMGAVLEVQ